MKPFIIKYLPKTVSDIIGQDAAISQLKRYVTGYRKGSKKALLLYGPAGTGKTSSVHALAKELDLEIIELNASDVRNAAEINSLLGAAVNQQSLFMKKKLILLDEIDGLSGMKDRGGLLAVLKLLEKSTYPIVLTATNPWGNKFSALRRKSELTAFGPLDYKDIATMLEKICKQEKIKYEMDVLKGLARRAGSDMRAAINDLETLSIETKELTKRSLEDYSERNRIDTMLTALTKIFKTTDPNIAITAFENVQENNDEQFLWIDKNLPEEYTNPEDLAKAYDKISKADVFRRRIRRWQHWRFLIYINALLTAGIAVSKKEKYKKFVQYKPTGRLLKIWWSNQKSMKKKAIAEKIAKKTHTSQRRVLHGSLPYFKEAAKKNKQFREQLTAELDLSREEVEWLKK